MQKALAAAYGISEIAASETLKKQCKKIEKSATEDDLEMSGKRIKCENVDNALIEWPHHSDGKYWTGGCADMQPVAAVSVCARAPMRMS